MPECPVCLLQLDHDLPAFTSHVNSHFEAGPISAGSASTSAKGVITGGDFELDEALRVEAPVHLLGGHDATRGHSEGVDEASRIQPESRSRTPPPPPQCFICGSDLSHLPSGMAREAHANACLDNAGFADEHPPDMDRFDFAADPWAEEDIGRSSGGGGQSSKVKSESGNSNSATVIRRSKGDEWWLPFHSALSSLPSNYTPTLIPILHKILLSSHSSNVTQRAILCHSSICHVKAMWGLDIGWGCGYRNFLMGLTAVLGAKEEYREGMKKIGMIDGKVEDEPGVRNLQLWMAKGWNEGYDPMGRQQFKNQIVGTRKWIGTSDMYVVFIAKGIPCKLYDFPKATGGKWNSATATHTALVRWVKEYFDEDDEVKSSTAGGGTSQSAFDVLMTNGKQPAGSRYIKVSNKMPLILQHAGHSRTIVGYEVNSQGNTNLLMFDPNGGIPSDIRESARREYQAQLPSSHASSSSSSSGPSTALKPPAATTSSNPAGSRRLKPSPFVSDDEDESEIVSPSRVTSGQKRRSESPEEEMTHKRRKGDENRVRPANSLKNWVVNGSGRGHGQGQGQEQAEWEKKPAKALGAFRVNLGTLSRNTEYQILAFTGGPMLTESEKQNLGRTVRGERIME